MKTKASCPDCGTGIGQSQAKECVIELCTVCGRQRIACECSGHDPIKSAWTGDGPDFAKISATSVVRRVHEDAIHPDSIYTKHPLEWFVGRNVKMAFQSANSRVEHMWVEVTGVDCDYLVGILNSDPVSVTHVLCGDAVTLSRVQIEAVDLTFHEWVEEVECISSGGDYVNRWRGALAIGNGFEEAYAERLTPRQALKRWRDFIPSNGDC